MPSLSRSQAVAAIVLFAALMGIGLSLRRWGARPALPPLPHAGSVSPSAGGPPSPAPGNAPAGRPAAASTRAGQPLVVHVAGCVRRPGVYSFAPGSRINDALKQAGGARPEADLDAVNLAARLADGVQIFIPRRQAAEPHRVAAGPGRRRREPSFWGPPASESLAPLPPGRVPLEHHEATGATRPPSGHRSSGPGKIHSPSEGRVNINRADADELQRLPHIGPAMAQRILDYRAQNGPFRSVDQLQEVRGIGEKRLAELRDLVSL